MPTKTESDFSKLCCLYCNNSLTVKGWIEYDTFIGMHCAYTCELCEVSYQVFIYNEVSTVEYIRYKQGLNFDLINNKLIFNSLPLPNIDIFVPINNLKDKLSTLMVLA